MSITVRRIGEVVGYFIIGSLFVGAFVAHRVLSPKEDWIDLRWIAFGVSTVMLLGFLIQTRWKTKSIRTRAFWGATAIFLPAHALTWWVVYAFENNPPTMYLGMVLIAEYVALDWWVELIMKKWGSR